MERGTTDVRVDLHVHSAWSNKPFSWFLRNAKAAECYTPAEKVYEIAMRRGMNLVTLSDHDVIYGALELKEKWPENTFISEEVSARFPEDGCIVHTIALDISEAQHDELQRLRRNIYELTSYMHQEGIQYFWCHPLSQVNNRLTKAHIERCLLMFRTLELRNGTRDTVHETRLVTVVEGITPSLLQRWAERHPQAPAINMTGDYAFVGGSDDHGSMAIARAYTTFEGQPTAASLTQALKNRTTQPGGEHGQAATLAHNCYGVLSGFVKSTGQLRLSGEGSEPSTSMLMTLAKYKGWLDEAGGSLDIDSMYESGHTSSYQHQMRTAADFALVSGWRAALERVMGELSRGRPADAADGVSDIIKAVLIELPYLLAARYHVRDRTGANRFADQLGFGSAIESPRVAVLTDSVDHINGVALGLRRLAGEARRWDLRLDLVAAGQVHETTVDSDGIVRIPSIYEHRLQEYPEHAWSVPHVPSLLRYIADHEIELVQCSTPGPMGVAGLIAARLTGIPVIGQYHTDLPEYALRLSGDPAAGNIVKAAVAWFYRQMDTVLVPSDWIAELMRSFGVSPAKIRKIPRGIDLSLFRPDRRNPLIWQRYGLGNELKVLYVGRISKEKNLDSLIRAFTSVSTAAPTARLILVGDGPHLGELRRTAGQARVMFTGPITGEELAQLYASADVFVFPSETETFGNAVVEAQAAGLPVIVANKGAVGEHVIDGITGLIVDASDPLQLQRQILRLLADPDLRARMGTAGQHHARRRFDMTEAVRGTFREYARILSEVLAPSAPPKPEPQLRSVRA